MATREVTMADGAVYHVDAPDTVSDADVASEVARQHTASIPHYSGMPAALIGAKKMIDGVASAASSIPGVGALDRLGQSMGMPSTSQANAYSDEVRANSNPFAVSMGQLAGSLMIPAGRGVGMARIAGDALGNAASGALLSDKKTAGGVAGDAAVSALGGEVGNRVMRGIGAAASPEVRKPVMDLIKRNVPMTPGQILGGAWQKAEDGIQGSVLGLGDMVAGARKRGLDMFNRATVNDVLKPLGVTLPDHIATGHDAVEWAKQGLKNSYNHVLGSMTANLDKPLQQEVGNIVQDSANGPVDLSSQVQRLWDTKVAPYFENGTMTGDNIKSVDKTLRETAKKYGKSTEGKDQDFSQAIGAMRTAVKGAASRTSGPDLTGKLGQVDSAYANFVRLRDAASKTADGVFTPAGLDTSVRVMDKSVGKGAKATGNAAMQDISSSARQVLPSTVPDSGTARRLAQAALIGGMTGGAAYGGAHSDSAGYGVIPLMLAGMYTKRGGAAMQGLLTGRQGAGAQAVRGLLQSQGQLIGRGVAAGVPGLLARPQP